MSNTGSKKNERAAGSSSIVNARPVIAVSSGEPAGIGPELCLRLAQRDWPARLIVLGDIGFMRMLAEQLTDVTVVPYEPERMRAQTGTLEVLHVPLAVPVQAGIPDRANAAYVLSLLDHAISGCLLGQFNAMVTAPVHKGIISDSGVPFSGHTEYLAEKTATPRVVMMLVGGGLRVALATTHLPLSAVPAAITADLLEDVIRILNGDLRRRFGLDSPRILVAGLNPHAGESGHMGREEIEVISPVLEKLRAEGLRLIGPLPADTLFVPHTLEQGDAALAMYHDQGLPVLKHASFGGGVNVTLGLPIIRTSVDHGTAFDLVGSGRADPGSLFAAVDLAIELSSRRDG